MPLRFATLFASLLLLAGCQSTGALGGTTWSVLDVIATSAPGIDDMEIAFGNDGMVTTTTTRSDGSTEETRRRYFVHGPMITVRRTEGDLSVLHRIDGDEMILTAEAFQARLLRMN